MLEDSDRTLSYSEIFQRNIGIFTKEEQERLRNLKVAIAGGGGLGGVTAYMLAKLGVGEIRIADPEEFEISNINRQFGAYVDTIGQNKAEAIAQELRRINPHIKAITLAEGIHEDNVAEFLHDVDLVVDGIEFFELDAVISLHREAAKSRIPIFTGQGTMEIFTYTSFLADSPKLESMIMVNGKPDIRKFIDLNFPILPKSLTMHDVDKILLEEETTGSIHISSYMVAPEMGVSILCQDIINVMIWGNESLATAPDMLILEIDSMAVTRFNAGQAHSPVIVTPLLTK